MYVYKCMHGQLLQCTPHKCNDSLYNLWYLSKKIAKIYWSRGFASSSWHKHHKAFVNTEGEVCKGTCSLWSIRKHVCGFTNCIVWHNKVVCTVHNNYMYIIWYMYTCTCGFFIPSAHPMGQWQGANNSWCLCQADNPPPPGEPDQHCASWIW